MRWLTALLAVGFAVLVWSADGGAQASSSLTITVQAEGAGAEDIFGVTVLPTDGDRIVLDLVAGTPETVEDPWISVEIVAQVPTGWEFASLFCIVPNFPGLTVDVTPPDGDPDEGIPLTIPDGEEVECVLTHAAVPTGTVRVSRVIDGIDPDPLARHQVVVSDGLFDPVILLADETREFRTNAGLIDIYDFPASGYGRFLIDCGGANVSARTRRLTEVTVPEAAVIDCVIITVADPVATVTIEKLAGPEAPEVDFSFRVTHPSRSGNFKFDLAPSLDPGFDGFAFDLGPGPYEFVELATEGWFLQDVSCSGVGFDFELIDQGFRVESDFEGNFIPCTFVNEVMTPGVGSAGDANCDGFVDIIDALVIALLVAQVRSEVQQCPLGDAAVEVFGPAADVDASGTIDIIDALVVARCSAGLPAVLCPDL